MHKHGAVSGGVGREVLVSLRDYFSTDVEREVCIPTPSSQNDPVV